MAIFDEFYELNYLSLNEEACLALITPGGIRVLWVSRVKRKKKEKKKRKKIERRKCVKIEIIFKILF